MFALLLIVFVGTVLVGWLVPMAVNSARPYGIAGDIVVPAVVGVAYAYVIYAFVAPMIGMSGWLLFIGTAIESIAVGGIMLWILRRIKR